MHIYVNFCSLVLAACPDDWKEHNNHCYKKFATLTSWDKARKSCMREYGDLADVKDDRENTFLTNSFGGGNWLGLTACMHMSKNLQENQVCDLENNAIHEFNERKLDRRPRFTGVSSDPRNYAVLNNADGSWDDFPKESKHSYICKNTGILPMNLCTCSYFELINFPTAKVVRGCRALQFCLPVVIIYSCTTCM